MKKKFDVSGMSCAACSARVEKAVNGLDGIENVNVNLLTNSMTVEYDECILDDQGIINAVTKAGYGAEVSDVFKKRRQQGTAGDLLFEAAEAMKRRLIWSIVLWVPLMYIAMGHMLGFPLPGFLTGSENLLWFALVQLVITAAIMVINRKYFISGTKGVLNRAPNMDTLVSVGALASVLYSIWVTIEIGKYTIAGDLNALAAMDSQLYFESAGTILTLITVGKYMEAKSKGKTTDAISKLLDLSPETAEIEDIDGSRREVPASQIVPGDIVIVKPGSRIPVDGIILSGVAAVDRSMLTGESMPVDLFPGDKVECGTINLTSTLRVRTVHTGEDTALANIIRLVDEAGGSKAPIARLADKVSGIFVPTVMCLALITLLVWLLAGAEAGFAVSMAVSVLVISCPCALGLATPVAIMVGTGKAAENGIIFRSGEYLEKTREIDVVYFDKTGTLTEGHPKVTAGAIMPGVTKTELAVYALSLEKLSEHPLSEAIVSYGERRGVRPMKVENFKVEPGMGVTGEIQGILYLAGNVKLMEKYGIDCTAAVDQLNAFSQQAVTPVLIAGNGKPLGMLGVSDTVRETSHQAVAELKEMGIESAMLTGDTKQAAGKFAEELGITRVVAEVLPGDKEKAVADALSAGRVVAMAGDGINDAPALARADIGIALGNGTDVAIESADVILMRDDPLDIATAIRLSKAVVRNIKINLFWAFIYNAIGIPLAAGVFYPLFGLKLNPMICAACMSLSSFCVVTNALRLRKFK